MSENKRDYGSAAASRRCIAAPRKANPATRADRSTKSLPALLVEALNETVVVTIDGERRVGSVPTAQALET
jgi:hypothetical protein